MPKWDLRQVKVRMGGLITPNLDEGEQVLEEYGNAGFELVNVVYIPGRPGRVAKDMYYFFRRPHDE